MTDFILQGLFALGATAGFCIIFKTPQKKIPICALVGASGWIVYQLTIHVTWGTPAIGNFLGAALVGLLSEILARVMKEPTTIFIAPGIMPLVPGYHMFKAMEQLFDENMASGGTWLADAFKLAAVIALGLLATGAVSRVIRERKITKDPPPSL